MLELTQLSASVVGLAYTSDGRRLVCIDQRGQMETWVGLRLEHRLQVPGTPRTLAVDPQQPVALVGCREGTVHRIDLVSGRLTQSVAMPLTIPVNGLAFVWMSRLLAVGQGERFKVRPGRVTLLDLQLQHPERQRIEIEAGVWGLAALTGQRKLVFSDGHNALWSWELSQPSPLRVGSQRAGVGLCICPQSRLVASATQDYTIEVCNLETSLTHATLKGHTSRVVALAFAVDGRTLLSGAWGEGDSRVWHLQSARSIRMDWAIGRIQAVACAPDGLVCAAGSDTGTVILWDQDQT